MGLMRLLRIAKNSKIARQKLELILNNISVSFFYSDKDGITWRYTVCLCAMIPAAPGGGDEGGDEQGEKHHLHCHRRPVARPAQKELINVIAGQRSP